LEMSKPPAIQTCLVSIFHLQTGAAAPSILKGLRHSAQRWTASGKGAVVLRWENAGE
jgi:hypothetical protein